MTEHRALEKKQITQGNNRKVQKPSGSHKGHLLRVSFFVCIRKLFEDVLNVIIL